MSEVMIEADGLAALLRRAKQLNFMDQWVRRRLPEGIRPHVHVANLNGGMLVLGADSAAWAARLRCLIPELLHQLDEERGAAGVREVRVRVTIPQKHIEPKRSPPPKISGNNAARLKTLADHTDDPALKSVLLRLAGRV